MNETSLVPTSGLPEAVAPPFPVDSLDTARNISPQYLWKLGKVIKPSPTGLLLAETYLKTQNLTKCQEVLKKEFNRNISLEGVKKYLQKPEIIAYLGQRWEELGVTAGWTRERWIFRMTEHMQAASAAEGLKERRKQVRAELDRGVVEEGRKQELLREEVACNLGIVEAKRKTLASGDLYAMRLVALVLGFEVPQAPTVLQNFHLVQANGRD